MSQQGSCHCGRVAFTVEGTPDSGMECNCSICSRRGHVLWFVPRTALKLTTPEADVTEYAFNKHKIRHCFCPTCGCGTFGLGAMPDGTPMAAINLRCLPDFDLDSVPRHKVDGKNF